MNINLQINRLILWIMPVALAAALVMIFSGALNRLNAGEVNIPAQPILSTSSTPADVSEALLQADLQFDSAHVKLLQLDTVDDTLQNTREIELWVIQSSGKYRVEVRDAADPSNLLLLIIGDGSYDYNSSRPEGPQTIPYEPPIALNAKQVGDSSALIATRRQNIGSELVNPSWLEARLVGDPGMMLGPFGLVQNLMYKYPVTVLGAEKLIEREALKLELALEEGAKKHLWVDVNTGVILRIEHVFDGKVQSVTAMTLLELDPTLPDNLFYVEH